MKLVLLVFSDQDRELRESLLKHFERVPDINAQSASNGERGLALLRNVPAPTYVVVGARLARDPDSAVEDLGGVAFFRQVRIESDVAVSIVLPRSNNEVQEAVAAIRLPPSTFFVEAQLPKYIERAIRNVQPPIKRLDVLIRATAGTNWKYRLDGINFKYEKSGELRIGKSRVEPWSMLSDTLESSEDWYESFCKLGRVIINGFCEANDQFRMQLIAGAEAAGGIQNTRVLFEIERAHYQIALEAIGKPNEDLPEDVDEILSEPWMVSAPLLRVVQGQDEIQCQLFDGARRPLRCLILCADTQGLANGLVDTEGMHIVLGDLPYAKREVRSVRQLFAQASTRSDGIASPETLGEEPQPPLTEDKLITALKEPWDIVHFVGHSYFKYEKGHEERGYLFVGPRDRPEAVDITKIAPFLRKCRLVYLSSCESGGSSFATAAARVGVPFLAGFRWKVADERATLYSWLFYRHLLKTHSIDRAFMQARRALHHRYPNDRTWASAMLVTSGRTRAP